MEAKEKKQVAELEELKTEIKDVKIMLTEMQKNFRNTNEKH